MRRKPLAMPARSALDWAAVLGMALAFAFWLHVQYTMLESPAILSLHTAIAVLLAIGLTFVTPALLSGLVPTTPAGQLLLSTKWRTVGLPVMVAMVIFLVYYAWQLLLAWWGGQPAVAESNYVGLQAVLMLILTIGVPALAWVQLSPEKWIQEIRQAHLVEKYKVQQQTELAILQGTMLRAQALAVKGWAELTAGEREELVAIGTGLVRAMDQTLGEIEHTLGQVAGQIIPMARLTDSVELIDALDVITESIIEARPELPAPPETADETSLASVSRREPTHAVRDDRSRPDAQRAGSETRLTGEARLLEPHRASSETRLTGEARLSGLTAPARQNYLAAREELTGAWTRADLEEAVSCSKPTANRLIAEWRKAGLVVDVTSPADHYRFTEVV